MKYKLFHFNAKDKSNWGDYQAEISELFNHCRKTLVDCLGLKTGFILLFLRKGTALYEQIMILLEIPTDSQRGYYWSVVIPTIRKGAELQGHCFSSDKELHAVIQNTMMDHGCYLEILNPMTGEVIKAPLSVSNDKGDKKNTTKFIETVVNWGSEYFSIEIPEPVNNEKGE
jgi:hypothetical protein